MLELSTRIDLKKVDQLLEETRHKAADLTPVFRGPVDSLVTGFFERQFETRGAAGGTPWPPVSALTQKLRGRPGHGHEGATAILRDVNVLWGSYVKSGGPDSIRVIEPRRYVRGSAVPYAAAHQEPRLITTLFGRPLKDPKAVPARPVIPAEMPPTFVADVETAVVEHLEPKSGGA